MNNNIVDILQKKLPSFLFNWIKYIYFLLKNLYFPFYDLYFKIKIKKVQANHKKALGRVRKKGKIKVVFFFINSDTWKYNSVYEALNENTRFETIVVVCPFTSKGNDFMISEFSKSISFCKKMKYNYFLGYNINKEISIDVKKILTPDIVFFSNPNPITSNQFLISNYLDTLTCYVPYSFRIDSLYEYNYNNKLVNLAWKVFYESSIHKSIAIKYAKNRGDNVVVSGHPHLDDFLLKSEVNPWKTTNHKLKRIIWGPHWTIKGYQNTGLDWACFLDYAYYFFELADEFSEYVQFALKPHPFLRLILEKEELWGKAQARKYFEKWETHENMQLVDGNYIELFQHSDALIHDSGAFMVEYLVLNKPVAYTLNDRDPKLAFNEFGIEAYNTHFIIRDKKELRKFIIDIIDNDDIKKYERRRFVKEKILVSENLSAMNIVNQLVNEIKIL